MDDGPNDSESAGRLKQKQTQIIRPDPGNSDLGDVEYDNGIISPSQNLGFVLLPA